MDKVMLKSILELAVYRTHNRIAKHLDIPFIDADILDGISAELFKELKDTFNGALLKS